MSTIVNKKYMGHCHYVMCLVMVLLLVVLSLSDINWCHPYFHHLFSCPLVLSVSPFALSIWPINYPELTLVVR